MLKFKDTLEQIFPGKNIPLNIISLLTHIRATPTGRAAGEYKLYLFSPTSRPTFTVIDRT